MSIRLHVVTAAAAALAVAFSSGAIAGESQSKSLLTQRFDARPVSQVEIGDFHFLPGQVAPVHTHAAPVFGYVSKGSIYYQVAGKQAVLLKAGDAFYEPVGPEILHFDNASLKEEAVFTDFNFERDGEPFIVFPSAPKEKIDRRSFPSERPAVATANTMTVVEEALAPAARLSLPAPGETVSAYVAEGAVRVTVHGEAPIVYLTGQTFYAPGAVAGDEIANASKSAPARVVTFHLSSVN